MSAQNTKARATWWVIRNQTAEHPERHWPDFELWLAKDPCHRRLYDAEERRWMALARLRLSVLRHYGPTPESLIRQDEEQRGRSRRIARICVLASCLAVLTAGVWLGWGRNRFDAHPWVTYQRGTEQLTPVSLADGSIFQLNANSHLRVRLTETGRQVALEDGEAYFDVSPSPTRPFEVTAGSMIVHAKGTAFAVKKEEGGEVETAVTQGTVEIESTDPPRRPSGTAQPAPAEVQAGQVATLGGAGQLSVVQADPTELIDRLAWANPYYRFDGMTLADTVALFNRYNVRKLEVGGPSLGQVRISGRFRLTEPDKFAESLQHLGIYHVIREAESRPDTQIVLLRK